ncbi:MAG: LptF/LptG family permease, partial [Rhizobiales bacterium]|nr:LptF/LptG family permease [Hyphomicrobiales bacterium]
MSLAQEIPAGGPAGGATWPRRTRSAPRLYIGRLTRGTVIQLALVLVLIEAIFLAEKFTVIFENALSRNATFWDVLLVLGCTAPEVFDLALPVALLIAVYRVLLHAREEREFLVLASVGIGTHQLVAWMVSLGGVALVLSAVVSGFVDPHARFGARKVLLNAEYRALRGGITPGQFYTFGSTTVFAGQQIIESPERRVFIHQRRPDDAQRVIVADRVRLDGPDETGHFDLKLFNFAVLEFADRFAAAYSQPPCADCPPAAPQGPASILRIGSFAQQLSLGEIIRFDLRGINTPAEWTLPELLGLAARRGVVTEAHAAEAGRRIARALLCLIAPLFAGLAVTLTTQRTQPFAMPLAAAALMAADLLMTSGAKAFAAFGFLPMIAVPLIFAGGFAIALTQRLVATQHAF